MLALDRDDELHLFEGLPKEWVRPGMVTKLDGIATPFGMLYLTLEADHRGKTARLKVKKLAANPPDKIVVHLDQWTSGPPDRAIVFTGDSSIDTIIKLK
jgi:hypothetical protein